MKAIWNIKIKDGKKDVKITGRYFSQLDVPYLFEKAGLDPMSPADWMNQFNMLMLKQNIILEVICERCVTSPKISNEKDADYRYEDLDVEDIIKIIKTTLKHWNAVHEKANKQAEEIKTQEDIGANNAKSFLPEEDTEGHRSDK